VPVILATQEAEVRKIAVQSQHQANSLRGPISKKKNHKKGLVEWLAQGIGPEFKPPYYKKKKKDIERTHVPLFLHP
jgi:hypothetical protein